MSDLFSQYDPSAGKTYPAVDPAIVARVEIFPPIGISRVGDSQSEYYYGPEVPGIDDHPFGSFRDSSQSIKRQAARFRVYAYDAEGNILGEINNSQKYQLRWTVHVANKKAAYYLFRGLYQPHDTDLRNPDVDPIDTDLNGDLFDRSLEGRTKLIVDPGARSIVRDVNSGDAQNLELVGSFQGSRPTPRKISLGELRTDDQGRLVFFGGTGEAISVRDDPGPEYVNFPGQPEIISEFDSIDWIDNVCDGWVDVEVTHEDRPTMASEIIKPQKATVLSAPPKFAWGVDSPTSLYDVIENIYKKQGYVEHLGTDFYKDIWPVLSGAYKLSWVNNKARQGHGQRAFGNYMGKEQELSTPGLQPDPNLRQQIFARLRKPDFEDVTQANTSFMPRLSGDDGDAIEPGDYDASTIKRPIQRFAALTELQYERFNAWKDGNFITGVPFTKTSIEEYDISEQPTMLTRAMLEQTIGDPLYPGIEMFWIAKYKEAYVTEELSTKMVPPFRVNHDIVLPGFLSRGLSLPWQSDFDQCNTHWWPSARPDDVIPENEFNPDILPKGEKWTEGLRDTPDDTSVAFFPGSTDMVRTWTKLGFVQKLEDVVTRYPVWVEKERILPRGYETPRRPVSKQPPFR